MMVLILDIMGLIMVGCLTAVVISCSIFLVTHILKGDL